VILDYSGLAAGKSSHLVYRELLAVGVILVRGVRFCIRRELVGCQPSRAGAPVGVSSPAGKELEGKCERGVQTGRGGHAAKAENLSISCISRMPRIREAASVSGSDGLTAPTL
jgi:hypothetical protein